MILLAIDVMDKSVRASNDFSIKDALIELSDSVLGQIGSGKTQACSDW